MNTLCWALTAAVLFVILVQELSRRRGQAKVLFAGLRRLPAVNVVLGGGGWLIRKVLLAATRAGRKILKLPRSVLLYCLGIAVASCQFGIYFPTAAMVRQRSRSWGVRAGD